jgi:hypothetical protein
VDVGLAIIAFLLVGLPLIAYSLPDYRHRAAGRSSRTHCSSWRGNTA